MFSALLALITSAAVVPAGDPKDAGPTAEIVRRIDPNVLLPAGADDAQRRGLRRMLDEHVRRRLDQRNQQDLRAWQSLRDLDGWEKLKAPRIEALRRSLGQILDPPRDLHVQTTKVLRGEGFRIECLIFESRPGLIVTANLYRPEEPAQSMPGILICHSHHNPKTQGELQEMGMSWARHGCLVLVMDQLGHGERRQHPFRAAADFPKPFPVGRQDYYFRYNVGMQLHLIGESQIGWMVWDLSRGVDLLLSQPGIDPARIVLLGAVAGGGDPAAVTAALDDRVKAAVPFNFGGPQPETVYPLPQDAERSFNYIGEGSWESTRNLRLSARDGFLPWVIVGAVAPRRLLYAHEFSWDRERDPVWKRLQTIYGFCRTPENLSAVHGWGQVRLSPAEASHCNNIGPPHREQIHAAFQKWFGISMEKEYRTRRPESELHCLEGVDSARYPRPTPLHRLTDRLAGEHINAVRRKLAPLDPAARREALRRAWARLLGDIEPVSVHIDGLRSSAEGPIRVIRLTCTTEAGIRVPVLLLLPATRHPPPGGTDCQSVLLRHPPHPCVVGVAQQGKRAFLQARAEEIAALLGSGIAVCLPDLRGTGETSPGSDRGRNSEATAISSSELMLGNTLVGLRLKDLRCVLRWLRTLPDIDSRRIAVWGDSLAAENGPGRRIEVPLGISDEPSLAEPLGPLLAILAGLFEDDVCAVVARGGLAGFRSVLGSPFVYIPHDVIVPGALTAGDIADVAGALAPRPLLVGRCVDGTNRALAAATVRQQWAVAASAYQTAGAPGNLAIAESDRQFVVWLVSRLGTDRKGTSGPRVQGSGFRNRYSTCFPNHEPCP